MDPINSEKNYGGDEVSNPIALLNNIPKEQRELIAQLAAEQKRRKLLSISKYLLIVIVIVGTVLIIRYDAFQRVFTPREYWSKEVRNLEYSVMLMELAVSKQRLEQTAWANNYNNEFENLVNRLQSDGLQKEEAIKKATEIMDSASQVIRELSNNVRSILEQFKKDLEIARQKLSKYDKR